MVAMASPASCQQPPRGTTAKQYNSPSFDTCDLGTANTLATRQSTTQDPGTRAREASHLGCLRPGSSKSRLGSGVAACGGGGGQGGAGARGVPADRHVVGLAQLQPARAAAGARLLHGHGSVEPGGRGFPVGPVEHLRVCGSREGMKNRAGQGGCGRRSRMPTSPSLAPASPAWQGYWPRVRAQLGHSDGMIAPAHLPTSAYISLPCQSTLSTLSPVRRSDIGMVRPPARETVA